MSACPTPYTSRAAIAHQSRPVAGARRVAGALGAAVAAMLTFTGAAAAAEPTVTKVDGNPTCAAAGADLRGVKLDPVPQGRTVFGDGALAVEITVSGRSFDWTSDAGVDAVIVKGGPTANVYRYGREAREGGALHAPIDPNGQPYGLSHITFCYDVDHPAAPKPCEPGGPSTKPDGSPCNPPAPKPCEPSGPSTTPDGTPCDGPTPPAEPATTITPQSPAIGSAPSSSGGVLGVRDTARRRVVTSASMSGPTRCVTRPFTQVVRGRGIRRVTISVNGRLLRTMRGGRRRYAVRIDPSKYAGVVRIKARVEFVGASRRRPQTLRMNVLRCAAHGAPGARFTG